MGGNDKKYSLIMVEPAQVDKESETFQKEFVSEETSAAHESGQEASAFALHTNLDQNEVHSSVTKPSVAQRVESKKEFEAKLKQEYKEELGTEKDVPFSRMRIFIIVLLVLFIVGFAVYYACSA